MEATRPSDKFFSEPDFWGPNGFFSPGIPSIEVGGLPPTSLDGFPSRLDPRRWFREKLCKGSLLPRAPRHEGQVAPQRGFWGLGGMPRAVGLGRGTPLPAIIILPKKQKPSGSRRPVCDSRVFVFGCPSGPSLPQTNGKKLRASPSTFVRLFLGGEDQFRFPKSRGPGPGL